MDTQRLQPARVAPDLDKLNARCQRMRTVIKRHSIGVHAPDQVYDIFHVVSVAEQPVAHVSATGVVNFLFLDMETRIGQEPDVASVVIVQVGDHRILDVLRLVAQHR